MVCRNGCMVTQKANHHVVYADELCMKHTTGQDTCYKHADGVHYLMPRSNALIVRLADYDAT